MHVTLYTNNKLLEIFEVFVKYALTKKKKKIVILLEI